MGHSISKYDPERYWKDLHKRGGLSSVGQSGLPDSLNRGLYRISRRNARRFLACQGLHDLVAQDVLDIGSGTGFWIEVWQTMGAREIHGMDLVPDAVERLRARFPWATFWVGDIAEPGAVRIDRTYDLVTVMNVLLHILDDERFAAAAANIARAVGPGGSLLLAEPALVRTDTPRPLRPGASSTARLLRRYQEAFEPAGLTLTGIGATTVIGANPIEWADPHYSRYAALWKRVTRSARRWPAAAAVIGVGLDVVDRLLMRTGAAPSGKFILFKRPQTDVPDGQESARSVDQAISS